MSSPTRGVLSGGYVQPNTRVNEFITIASTGNAQEFGDMYDNTYTKYGVNGVSNSIRGLVAGGIGDSGGGQTKFIESITIASAGNATLFGDLSVNTRSKAGVASPTRGVYAGGRSPADPGTNAIEYVTIATEGNGVDFGDLLTARYEHNPMGNAHGGLG